ncbi:unnamed protein product [Didymodactylos carnosus]|uniref:Flavin-containing monooxygenase n=1 Tax=Didymodactylos carnosus TaxID=1234261 RepID=A0A815VPZ0_9BILA|nr:unnamed protein product [Didymodactylos carnosus]CAF1538577.1 unnamed protein product [Didymodactylos carnosus]CAF3794248.1 unnamed protein product [Didymodactylos carnosus]CAF4398640.1 unnamed protein product [Didymodactylos carnosus]
MMVIKDLPPIPLYKLLFYVLIIKLISIISVIVGLTGHCIYYTITETIHLIKIILYGNDDNAIKWENTKTLFDASKRTNEYYMLIIGSGFSGLGLAIKLNEIGMFNYMILERHSRLGGTWHANQYPGCACDVVSNLYSFSFQQNPNWSHYYSRQDEIWKYLEYCADKYHLMKNIQFNTNVSQCHWIEERQQWRVTFNDNQYLYAQYLVGGYGPLSNAKYPDNIEGIRTFQGDQFHSANWDTSYLLDKKRVAVIGTGASAIQIVPEIQKQVKQLFVFQRTPGWIVPREDRKVTEFEKKIFAYFPWIQKLVRGCLYWTYETTVLSFVYRWPLRHVLQMLMKYNLYSQVKDPELRKKLTPKFELGKVSFLSVNSDDSNEPMSVGQ